jgi:hypothetical protein
VRDLYRRYQAASRAVDAHDRVCQSCTRAERDRTGRTARCDTGARLHETFARLQDAYLSHLNKRT